MNKNGNAMSVYIGRFFIFLVLFMMLFLTCVIIFFISLNTVIMKKGDFSNDFAVQPISERNVISVNLPLDDYVEETEDELNYLTDLSAYDKYINPENRDEYLVLINVANPLDPTYIPTDLLDVVDTRQDGRATQKLREYAAKALEALLIEARANGFNDITVTSAYRSYDYQTTLYNQRVAMYPTLSLEDAKAKAATIVAIPGTSEHQSGLCLDMHNIGSADVSFANTKQAQWLAENSYKFGYILRFPEDKIEITGISFEPWHFRYVGRYHAAQMYELGLCFEEYMDYLGGS
jgi:D-alanyl-D-alanine carboxypeptidase